MAKINLKVLTDIKQSEQQLKALATSIDSIAKSFSSVKVDKNLTAQINALTKHYNAVAKAAEKVAKVNYNNEIQTQKLAKATAQANKAIADEATAIEKSKTQFAKHQKAVNDDARAQEKHEAQMKKSTAQTQKSTEQNKKHSQSIASMLPNILKWQIAMTAVMLPLRKIQEALESVNETLIETEKRVVSLQRVAGQAANANELYDLAQKYGQTFDNVADVVENLVKSGYTWEESLKAAEPALLAINVAELDAAQATEGLIAVVKQYGMELEDLNYIQGVLNKTADNAAVTTEKLLIALQKTGSTAKNANVSFEDTVGLITALSEGTAASGQNIGNALRSLFVFTSDRKALDSFAGLSDGMAETVKKYRAGKASILDVWKGLGGVLQGMNSQKGTLEDLFGGTALTADIEAQLTQITDAFAEIYGTAGNYRQNYFIALLDNIEKVEDATKDLGDATTYSQKENVKYLETYEAKVNNLNAKWKELANDEQGFLAFKKGLIDAASSALDLLETLGGIDTVIKSISITGATLLLWFKPTIITGINSGLQSLIGIIPNAITAWKAYASGIVTANTAMSASIPVLGLLLVGITAVTGAISAHKQAQHEANQAAIQNWESIKSQTAELDKLYDEYKNLTPEAKNYAEVEKGLVSALGEKAVTLKGLTEGTDEYREALKNLVEYELYSAKLKYTDAHEASKKELLNNKLPTAVPQSAWKDGKFPIDPRTYFKSIGYDFDIVGNKISGLSSENTVEAIIKNKSVYEDMLTKFSKKFALSTDEKEKRDISLIITWIEEQLENISPYLANYNNTKDILEHTLSNLQKIEEETSATSDNVSSIKDNLSDLDNETLDSIIKKLRLMRQETQDAYNYESKKLAVMEAEKALQEARENRVVRVFNPNTGMWEWQSNEREIQNAEQNLAAAKKNVEDSAYDEIENALENKKTNEEIRDILQKWAGAYGTGSASFVKDIIDLIQKETGITIVANEYDPTLLDPTAPLLHDRYVSGYNDFKGNGNDVKEILGNQGIMVNATPEQVANEFNTSSPDNRVIKTTNNTLTINGLTAAYSEQWVSIFEAAMSLWGITYEEVD